MKKKLLALTTSLLLISAPLQSQANIGGEVNNWFADQDYANVTNPQVVETQAGRMYSLGGIQTRNQVKGGFNFFNIQPPRASAGCSGIDVYAGGFNFVNKDQFVASLKAIGQNAKSLAFMMAIKIASSQFEDELSKVQEWANKFNQFQMDSCAAANALIDYGVEQTGFTKGCIALRMERKGESYHDAEMECKGGGASDVMSDPKDPDKNEIIFTQGNLTWSVLMQDNYFASNLELAEIMMNLVGTVIVDASGTSANDSQAVAYKLPPALGSDYNSERFKGLFDYFYLGNETNQPVTFYECTIKTSDPLECQKVQEVTQMPTNQGMKSKIDAVLVSIANKIKTGTNLSNEEKGVIASSSIPILRYISASTASSEFLNNNASINANVADKFSAILAYDLVLSNLNGLVDRIRQNALNQKDGLSQTKEVMEFADSLDHVLAGIRKLEAENNIRAINEIEIRQEIKEYEKEILSKVSRHYVEAANFNK